MERPPPFAVMCLLASLVSLVFFWHCISPFTVEPSPEIVDDLLSKIKLEPLEGAGRGQRFNDSRVEVENWTKWRIYVDSEDPLDVAAGASKVILPGTQGGFSLDSDGKAVMRMEWRQEYLISVEEFQTGGDEAVRVNIKAPLASCSEWGIFRHFTAFTKGKTIQILPRYLFGLSKETIRSLYADENGDVITRLPIVGVFARTTSHDKIIIQSFMSLITVSIVLLLWVNNPPNSLSKEHISAGSKVDGEKVSKDRCKSRRS